MLVDGLQMSLGLVPELVEGRAESLERDFVGVRGVGGFAV